MKSRISQKSGTLRRDTFVSLFFFKYTYTSSFLSLSSFAQCEKLMERGSVFLSPAPPTHDGDSMKSLQFVLVAALVTIFHTTGGPVISLGVALLSVWYRDDGGLWPGSKMYSYTAVSARVSPFPVPFWIEISVF